MKGKRTKPERRALRLEWIEAGSLAAHPDNWRRHPPEQAAAFKALLGEVGWAGALLYNARTKRIIDGHLRAKSVPPATPMPVLVGDWTEEQERTILATLDPLAAMATVDADALDSLLAEVDLSVPGLAGLAAGLDAMVDRLEAADDRAANAEARVTAGPGAAKTHGPAVAERYLVVVECDTEKQQAALFRRLKKDGLRCRIETS